MRKFDYSFLNNGLIPTRLVNLTANISELKALTSVRKKKHVRVFTELESVAKIQSVKSSNEMEGIMISDERIVDIVNQNSPSLNRDEAEIAGYRDALNEIYHFDFSQTSILRLYEIMTQEHDGQYTTDNNMMEQMELAYLEARNDSNINQLLLIPCVILDFLCIRPFKDGNGKMSRLLSLLLLYKNEYDIGKYISFEDQINRHRDYYYESLRRSSEGWDMNENSYFPFIENFLSMLYMCYKELDKRFAMFDEKRVTKRDLIEMTVLNSLSPISKSEICKRLPDVSKSTIEAVLNSMLKDDLIKKIGTTKSAKYIRAK